MKNNWIIIVIAIVIIGAIVWMRQGSPSGSNSYQTNTPKPTAVATSTAKVTPRPSVSASGRSYDQLVKDYANTRVQFDAQCRATPTSLALKTGSQILLDNRSNQSRVVTVDGASYTLLPYGYQVVTVSSTSLPKTIGINCGSSVNVSSINLQSNISGQ